MRVQGLPLWLSLWGGGGVHWVQVVRSCSLSLGVFRPFSPCLLSASLHCACRVACEYGSISRFKGVLRGFYGADVCLYGFGVFALIVWLLCACGVRRFRGLWRVCLYFVLSCLFLVLYFVLYLVLLLLCLPFFLPLCSCFLCLSSCPLLVLSLFVGCCFFFPYGICAKRKGAKCFCVLSCPAVCCFIWLLLYIPRTLQVSARLYRNKVLEKGNLTECSKLFCARLCSCLCSSKFVLFLFSYLLPLVGSYFLFPFG